MKNLITRLKIVARISDEIGARKAAELLSKNGVNPADLDLPYFPKDSYMDYIRGFHDLRVRVLPNGNTARVTGIYSFTGTRSHGDQKLYGHAKRNLEHINKDVKISIS